MMTKKELILYPIKQPQKKNATKPISTSELFKESSGHLFLNITFTVVHSRNFCTSLQRIVASCSYYRNNKQAKLCISRLFLTRKCQLVIDVLSILLGFTC
jgi:hypothetical protein